MAHGAPSRIRLLLAALLFVSAALSDKARAEADEPAPAAPRTEQSRRVQAAVDKLAAWVAAEGGVMSAAVVDVASGSSWAVSGANAALNPASNMKIVTAAAALDRLGPEYRYTTGLYGERRGDTIENVVLRGHGDPSLRVADLWRLVHSLERQGVRRVKGGIRVDQSRFDDQFVPPAFGQQPDEWASFRAPISAVAVERNTTTLNVLAAAAGQPARVWFEPPGFVEIAGEIETRPAGSGQAVRLTLKPKGAALTGHVGGHVAEGLPRLRFRRRVDDPRAMPGLVLQHLFEEAGIQVDGDVTLGGSDVTSRLVYVASEPLAVLVRQLGKHSDNFCAEMILKTLAGEASNAPATSQQGAKIVTEWLASIGAKDDATRIVNGSGLFDANRLSARTLTRVLAHAYSSPALRHDFVAQLSIGGVDGTLKSRFRSHRQSRIVRAKTGTLARAIALSGYILSPDGQPPVAFSFLVTGIAGKHWAIRKRIDDTIEAVIAEVQPDKSE